MKFITDAPPPTYVESRGMLEQVVRHCKEGWDQFLGVDTETLGLLKDPDLDYIDNKGKTQYLKYTNMTDQVVETLGLRK